MSYVRHFKLIAPFIISASCIASSNLDVSMVTSHTPSHAFLFSSSSSDVSEYSIGNDFFIEARPLNKEEAKALFAGEGKRLLQNRPSKRIMPIALRITNKGQNARLFSKNDLLLNTLSKEELAYVLGKHSIRGRLFTAALAGLIMIAPAIIAFPLFAYAGLVIYSLIIDGLSLAALSFPMFIPTLFPLEFYGGWAASAACIFGVGTPLVDHYGLRHMRLSSEVRNAINALPEEVMVLPGQTEELLVFTRTSDYSPNIQLRTGWVNDKSFQRA